MKMTDPTFLVGLTGMLPLPCLMTVQVRVTTVITRDDGHAIVRVEPVAGSGATWADPDDIAWDWTIPKSP